MSNSRSLEGGTWRALEREKRVAKEIPTRMAGASIWLKILLKYWPYLLIVLVSYPFVFCDSLSLSQQK